MERWIKRAVELGAGIVFGGREDASVIPYYPQKTEISGYERPYFNRTVPERMGVSSGRLTSMIRALEKDKRVNIHALLCLKGAEVICECAHPGYGINTRHLSHSMAKTVTGMAVGMLVDDGKLTTDTRLIDIFPEIPYNDRNFERITVEHLLTMTAGVRFSEAGSVTESFWTEAYFASSCAHLPGTEFLYNSMNSYILAASVVRIAGMSLTDFLDERLFGPLHIVNRFWEVSAEGIEKGGWGLYLSAESWAKIGYMMLRGGIFEGRRILSDEWIRASITAHATPPERAGDFNYGYHLWTSSRDDSCLFNGMLGQNVWICPGNDLVAVILAGNNELFLNSSTRSIIEEYLSVDLSSDLASSLDGDIAELRHVQRHFFESRHMIRPYVPRKGIAHRLGLKAVPAYPPEWDDLIGKYTFPENRASILPLIMRVMQNNLYGSLESIEFERDGDSVFLVWTEGNIPYRLEIGFGDFKETVMDFHGEKYIAKVIGEAMEDEDRNMLYKLEILFPEMPNTRLIKFSFTESGGLLVRPSEMPGGRIADEFINELSSVSPRLSSYIKLIERRFCKGAIKRHITDTFSPALVGARPGDENYSLIMGLENEKREQEKRSTRWMQTVIMKLLMDDVDEDGQRGFIGEIVGKMKLKMTKRQRDSDPANGS